PPEDPAAGFLPPDVVHPEGEGSVAFTVEALPGLPSGTAIANQAQIVFDSNDPIDTPVWSNTLDLLAPSSQVNPLPGSQPPGSFPVSWTGSDAGSGVLDYSIFVATDGGAYQVWRENTTSTTDNYSGVAGHSYAFYSVARDALGHVEDAPATPDATTQAVLGATVGPFVLSFVGPAPNPTRDGGLTVAFTLPDGAHASLEVLDVSGRRVARRSVGELGAGRHRLDLARGEPVPPGIYLIRLS